MSYSKAIFNSKKLIENLDALPTKKICAVVKANAYGVGVKQVCQCLKGRVMFFAVASLQEALQIRKFDKTTPLLVLGICEDFRLASINNISVTIENLDQLKQLISENFVSKIHLKINTGMNRYGIKNKKILKKIIKIIKNNKNIIFEGVFTHLYFLKNSFITKKQLSLFNQYLTTIQKNFKPIVHIGGGAVCDVLRFDDYRNFMVRVGLSLYKNVISIKSQLVKVFTLNKHEGLGYDSGFIASNKTVVGIVPLGYADGINRKLSNSAYVQIGENMCKIIGNICMDCFFVDVTGVKCGVGTEVLVFDDEMYWAKICDTIPYEILTSLKFLRLKKEII